MARIKQELAATREKCAFEAFLKDPDLKVPAMNDLLFTLHGFRMNLSRAYQLKKQADEQRPPKEQA